MAAEIINKIQSKGPIAALKHFVASDQEEERHSVDTIVSARALREVYFLPFMMAARESRPAAVMTSYNKVNGIHCSKDNGLLRGI